VCVCVCVCVIVFAQKHGGRDDATALRRASPDDSTTRHRRLRDGGEMSTHFQGEKRDTRTPYCVEKCQSLSVSTHDSTHAHRTPNTRTRTHRHQDCERRRRVVVDDEGDQRRQLAADEEEAASVERR
jgi:hypothetical protein